MNQTEQNTIQKPKMTTARLAKMGMLVAISVVLVYLIHFPIFPAVAFLEYDPADIPILIGTFAFGPLAGVLLTVVTAVLLGNLAGLLPLFPGGIGARDLTVISILVAGGLAAGEAKTAQLLYTALLIAFNIFGGVFFLIDPGRSRTVEILRQAGEKSENE